MRLSAGFAGGFLRRQRASTYNNHYKKIKEHVQDTYLFVVGGASAAIAPRAPINQVLPTRIKEHMPSGTDLLAAGGQRRAHSCPTQHYLKKNKKRRGATGTRTPDPLLAKQVL